MIGVLRAEPPAPMLAKLRALADRWIGPRLRRSLAWVTAGSLVARGSIVLAMMLSARILGQHEFGQLVLLLSTGQLLHIFVAAGLGSTVVRFVAVHRTVDPAGAGRVLALVRLLLALTSALVVAALALFGREVSALLFGGGVPIWAVWLAGAYIVLSTWAELQAATLSALEEFAQLARVQFAVGPATLALVGGGSTIFGLPGAVGGFALAALLQLALGALLARTLLRRHAIPALWGWTGAEIRLIPTYALPAFANSLIWLPPIWFANYLLTRQPGGYAELGLFGAANQWFLALNFLPLMLTRAALPVLSSHVGRGELGAATDLLRRGVRLSVLSVALPAVALVLASPYVMALYGQGFARGWPMMALMCATAVIASGNGVTQNFLLAVGRPWLTAYINVAWATTFFVLALVLIPPLLGVGLSAALLGAYVLKSSVLLITARAVRHRLGTEIAR